MGLDEVGPTLYPTAILTSSYTGFFCNAALSKLSDFIFESYLLGAGSLHSLPHPTLFDPILHCSLLPSYHILPEEHSTSLPCPT